MGFYDAFFGSDQSLYTAYAIIAAIIAICLTILLTSTDVPVGNRFLIVFFVIITLVPSIFLTLFELTCIVTGGTEPNRWWCHAFAWILAAFIIIYCIIVVIMSLVSLFNYNKAIDSINNDEQKYKISNNDSNNYAKEIIQQTNKPVEKFETTIPDPFSRVSDINDITSAGSTDPGINKDKEEYFQGMRNEGFNNMPSKDTNTSNNSWNNVNYSGEEQQMQIQQQPSQSSQPSQPSQSSQPSQPSQSSQSLQSLQSSQPSVVDTTPSGPTDSRTLKFSNFNSSSETFDMFDKFYNIANYATK
jgi:hypothetical protein